jgi:hypothetical protein
VLVMEKESLDWQRLEGKRLGERLGAPTVLFMGVAKRSWPWIVVHISRNLEGGEAFLTESPSGRLEFKLSLSYGPPWAHYLGGYQDRLLGGPLGLPGLRYTAPDGVEHKDYRGEVLG